MHDLFGLTEHPSDSAEVTPFGSLSIAFDDRILRPRAWTADQSYWSSDLLSTAPAGPVLELCAGAGHIGLLALVESRRSLVCVDLSPVACSYARANAQTAQMSDRVEVREGPMETVLEDDERFGLVIADPPWVPQADLDRYPQDPLLAIDGGDDGLAVARLCVDVARNHLLPGGILVLQIGTTQQAQQLGAEVIGTGLALKETRLGERGVLVRFDLTQDA